ncbi:MAG: oxidase [Ilumatobacteraceae bacterium]|nr:oxidase [Ilumatobacteraceae bacterium]
MTDFRQLLSPGAIGSMPLRNRIVLPGMDMNHCEGGAMTDREIDHYAARAAGGCALVTTGASAIAWPIGSASWREAGLGDDKYLPGLTRLAEAVHAGGAKLSVQLVHHGKVAGVDTAEGRPLLVPSIIDPRMDMSALVDNSMDELMRLGTATQGKQATYHEATTDDIAWVVDKFADAAGRLQRAGVDAVEIHGAHGYLINTFLSRAFNHRTDEYGGSLENRARLLVEVIRAVRARVGDGMAISVRLNGCEYGLDDGITIDETVATAKIAEAAGADVISISAQAGNPFRDFTKGPLPAVVGQYRTMAAAVKAAIGIPVIAVGRLLPELAEEMLANGECDFVAMGRQQLADPQLANKIAAGRRASVRPCINCYVCVEQNFFDGSAICAVNPALGNESAAADAMRPAATPRHVVVVGAGPGGLEAARIAAGRGHRVTLLERSASIGGTTWFATLAGTANQMLVDWLAHETEVDGIDLRLGTDATAESIAALAPDAVVLATGGALLHGDEVRARVTALTAAGPVASPVGSNGVESTVAIIGGDLIGLTLAQHLSGLGHGVTVLEPGKHLGLAMAMPRRWTAVVESSATGVTLVRSASDDDIAAATAAADHVIDTRRVAADDRHDPLAGALAERGIETHTIGDASPVGYIQGAMHGAHAVASAL